MRKLLLILLAAATLYAHINALIEQIITVRDGASETMIKSAPNPFASSEQERKSKKFEPRLELKAVFDDQALINDHWVKLGQAIDGYKIVRIDSKSVLLQNGEKQKALYLKTQALF